jgi:threonine dehydrogenase-like Zn-dependent dehydrogenase
MCFRPSAVSGSSNKGGTQYTECPSCGQPVAANAGVTSGTCPYCYKPIPTNSPSEQAQQGNDSNPKIL